MSDNYIDLNRAAFDAFKALPRDEPCDMLNLIRFRAVASYPTDYERSGEGLSGLEAYREFGRASVAAFKTVGGTILWRGSGSIVMTGPSDEAWDLAFIARYPNAHAFLALVVDPAMRAGVMHRQAAVLTSRVIRLQPESRGAGFAGLEA